jgi:hypothetical protein
MTAVRCGFNSATSGSFGDEFWSVCGDSGLSIQDAGRGARMPLFLRACVKERQMQLPNSGPRAFSLVKHYGSASTVF